MNSWYCLGESGAALSAAHVGPDLLEAEASPPPPLLLRLTWRRGAGRRLLGHLVPAHLAPPPTFLGRHKPRSLALPVVRNHPFGDELHDGAHELRAVQDAEEERLHPAHSAGMFERAFAHLVRFEEDGEFVVEEFARVGEEFRPPGLVPAEAGAREALQVLQAADDRDGSGGASFGGPFLREFDSPERPGVRRPGERQRHPRADEVVVGDAPPLPQFLFQLILDAGSQRLCGDGVHGHDFLPERPVAPDEEDDDGHLLHLLAADVAGPHPPAGLNRLRAPDGEHFVGQVTDEAAAHSVLPVTRPGAGHHRAPTPG